MTRQRTVDDRIIRKAQNGDETAFESLLELQYDTIYRFAYRWAGCQSDAEDITQLSCIKLAKSLKQFRFESAFTSWLYRLVINCAKDWEKSQRRHQIETLAPTMPTNKTSQAAENAIFLDQVIQYLDGLGNGFKETVLLVLVDGLTHKEAAQVLEVKETTISWRLHEIRKLLAAIKPEADAT